MQHADDCASLAMLLREEVEAQPLVAYRLLELLARTGWAVRIDRGEGVDGLVGKLAALGLPTAAASMGRVSRGTAPARPR